MIVWYPMDGCFRDTGADRFPEGSRILWWSQRCRSAFWVPMEMTLPASAGSVRCTLCRPIADLNLSRCRSHIPKSMILYFCFAETTCSHGSVGTVVPKSELWDILSEATDRSKSRIGQADFGVGTVACLHANARQTR